MGYVGKCPELAQEVEQFRQTVGQEKRLASKSFEKTMQMYWKHQNVKRNLSRRPRKKGVNDHQNPAVVFCEARAQDPESPLHVVPKSKGLSVDATPELAMTFIGLNPDVRRLRAFGIGGKASDATRQAVTQGGSQPLMDAAMRPPNVTMHSRRPKSADGFASGAQTARQSSKKAAEDEEVPEPVQPRPHSVCGSAATAPVPHSARGSYDGRDMTSSGRFLAQFSGLAQTPYQGDHPGDIPEMQVKEGGTPNPSKDLLVRLFAHGVSHEGEGRAGYLKARKWAHPPQKYSRPLTEAQQVGWGIETHQYATMSHSRKSPTKHFFRATPCSSLHRHEDNPRML
jgi:hypothetical protein